MARSGLSGNLKTMSLPDLLQWASRGGKTGTLVLTNEPMTKRIYFRSGAIIGSSSNDPRDYLGQVLLSEGLITEQQLKEAMDQQGRAKVMLGRILVQRSKVTEAKVAAVLRQKAEETIYSLFLWSDAQFEFLDGGLPPGELVLISVRPEEVLLEGVRRYDTSRKIREVLPHNAIVLARTQRPLPEDIAARPFPRRIYELVDGRRTLADIVLEAHASEFNACHVLYSLVQHGYAAVVQPAPVAGRAAAGTVRFMQGDAAARLNEPVIQAARACLEQGDPEGALAVLDALREAGVRTPDVLALCQEAERAFVERAYRHYLPASKIAVLRRPLDSLVGENLSSEEIFLVSRVNGTWDLRSIMSISPLREVDALRALKKLRERRIIDLVDPPEQARTA